MVTTAIMLLQSVRLRDLKKKLNFDKNFYTAYTKYSVLAMAIWGMSRFRHYIRMAGWTMFSL